MPLPLMNLEVNVEAQHGRIFSGDSMPLPHCEPYPGVTQGNWSNLLRRFDAFATRPGVFVRGAVYGVESSQAIRCLCHVIFNMDEATLNLSNLLRRFDAFATGTINFAMPPCFRLASNLLRRFDAFATE